MLVASADRERTPKRSLSQSEPSALLQLRLIRPSAAGCWLLAASSSIAQLAEKVGYSIAQVSRYETGKSSLTDVVTRRLFIDALGLPPQALGLSSDMPADGHGHDADVFAGYPRLAATMVRMRCGVESCWRTWQSPQPQPPGPGHGRQHGRWGHADR
ncbi:helix-turn-helix domain-containing protein [Streptomyces sp. NPDC101062]|uniref:helix-turn-helix domain-containing protein n=1 Tax=unclassified Streptomyces TaxID=2593676 RepID=UPI003811615E